MKVNTIKFTSSTYKHSKPCFVRSRETDTTQNSVFSTTPTTTNAGTLSTPQKSALRSSAMTTAPKATTESNNCNYFSYFLPLELPFIFKDTTTKDSKPSTVLSTLICWKSVLIRVSALSSMTNPSSEFNFCTNYL